MTTLDDKPVSVKLRLKDWMILLGSLGSILIGFGVWLARLDNRIGQLEADRTAQSVDLERLADKIADIRTDVSFIRGRIENNRSGN